ncbi:MAG: hypothetical protein HY868_10085 [Chloroflexi bacterium]|nr:hypothetical protein [Chloroflexota bacterium]
MRDDFDDKTKNILARRVGLRCSNPKCRKLTSGPQTDPAKAINIGVASHITAASPGGPRYNPSLSPEQRKSVENGIWLCQSCSKLIDSDERRYTIELLKEWKRQAEMSAQREVEEGTLLQNVDEIDPLAVFSKLLDVPENWIKVQGDEYIRHRYQSQFVIKMGRMINDDYREPWAQRFPDPHATSFQVEYWLGATLLKSSLFVTTDGGRFHIPAPRLRKIDQEREDWSSIEFSIDTTSLEWKTAMLFDQYDDLWERLPIIGIKLVQAT